MNIEIHLGTIDEVVTVNETIDEFDTKFTSEHFQQVLSSKKNPLIAIAYSSQKPVGFQICYQEDNHQQLFLWCAAVNKDFRNQGVMSQLLDYVESYCHQNKINQLLTDTSNRRPKIIRLLIKHGYQIIDFQSFPDILDNKIYLTKLL